MWRRTRLLAAIPWYLWRRLGWRGLTHWPFRLRPRPLYVGAIAAKAVHSQAAPGRTRERDNPRRSPSLWATTRCSPM